MNHEVDRLDAIMTPLALLTVMVITTIGVPGLIGIQVAKAVNAPIGVIMGILTAVLAGLCWTAWIMTAEEAAAARREHKRALREARRAGQPDPNHTPHYKYR